jgi:hypothetical protein
LPDRGGFTAHFGLEMFCARVDITRVIPHLQLEAIGDDGGIIGATTGHEGVIAECDLFDKNPSTPLYSSFSVCNQEYGKRRIAHCCLER